MCGSMSPLNWSTLLLPLSPEITRQREEEMQERRRSARRAPMGKRIEAPELVGSD